MIFDKADLSVVNEQIDIACRKTANQLLFALENDRKCYCKIHYSKNEKACGSTKKDRKRSKTSGTAEEVIISFYQDPVISVGSFS